MTTGSPTRRDVLGLLLAAASAGCVELFRPNPSDTPDYEVPVPILNDHAEQHVVRLEITGADGSPLHKEVTRELPPNGKVKLRPFTDLEDTGAAAFQIHVRVDDAEAITRTAEMNRCFVALEVRILANGDVDVSELIC